MKGCHKYGDGGVAKMYASRELARAVGTAREERDHPLFDGQEARFFAMQIVASLAPFCERIEIAGSIRRMKDEVHDIDIIAIPKTTTRATGLFETMPVNLLKERVLEIERENAISVVKDGVKIMRWIPAGRPPIPVDLYFATEATWATLLLIRTGSAAHNIRLCQRAKSLGLKLHADGSGITFSNGNPVIGRGVIGDERDIFTLLGMECVPPERRE